MLTNLPQTKLSIPLPPGWTPPKYRLGRLTQQGWIVGMTYHPGFSALGRRYTDGAGWRYEVLADWQDTETETVREEDIKLLPKHEEEAEVKAEIALLKQQISAMEEALNA
ncbi:hypothetical protein [Iningainema tapete]|nr:hypothetical protein [Iningainema tapete]